MLQAAGADRVLTMDLHAGQIQGFFSIPVDHMTALPLFARHYRGLGLHGVGVVSVSPDLGRVKSARRFAQMLDAGLAIVTKVRPGHELAAAAEVVGDVDGKIAVIGDDMIVTGGTLVAAAEALRQQGAREVHVFATHALFTPGTPTRLEEAGVTAITVTDTVALDHSAQPETLTVLSTAELLAGTIRNVFADQSVSALFAGENELF